MKPIFSAAQQAQKRLVFAQGEFDRILHAVHQIVSERIALPVLIGDTKRITEKVASLGLSIQPGTHFEIVDPESITDDSPYIDHLYQRMWRKGLGPAEALPLLRNDPTALACLLLQTGEVDAALVGPTGRFYRHLETIEAMIGRARGIRDLSTLNALVLPKGTFFVCDTYVSPEPSAEELAELCRLAADEVRRFGLEPRIAFLSASNYGSRDMKSALRVRKAVGLIKAEMPDLNVDGEMHADAALSEALREREFPHSSLQGEANLWIMPNLDAANISFNLLKQLGGGVSIGPILLGAAKPIHIATRSVTTRGLLNMAALAVAGAASKDQA